MFENFKTIWVLRQSRNLHLIEYGQPLFSIYISTVRIRFSILQVPSFENKHEFRPCMVAPTKIIAGLGLSLSIDILEAPGASGDYRTLLTSKASAIAKALSAPLQSCPNVFVPGEEAHIPGFPNGYDFGFLHIKVITFSLFMLLLHV